MKIVLFSENYWNSPLKYQRHHLAEYLCDQEEVEQVLFMAKASIKNIRLKDFISIFCAFFLSSKAKTMRKKPSKLCQVNFLLFPYQRGFGLLNVFLERVLYKKIKNNNIDWNDTLLITYQPIPQILNIIDKFNPRKSVYISVHDYQNMYGVAESVVKVEKKIISKIDLFTTDAEALFYKLNILNNKKREIPLTPACPLEVVSSTQKQNYTKNRLKKLIYFGTIAGYLDFEIIQRLAEEGVIVDFLGVEYNIELANIPRIERSSLISPMDFEKAAKLVREYDGIILPYKINDRNDLVIPAKIYECFSVGLPIFVPNMKWTEEEAIKGLVYVYDSADDLVFKIKSFDLKKFEFIRPEMINIAYENTWCKRFYGLYEWMKL